MDTENKIGITILNNGNIVVADKRGQVTFDSTYSSYTIEEIVMEFEKTMSYSE
jgi:hypothetical protein